MCNQSPKCQNVTLDFGQCSLYPTALPFVHNAVLCNQAYASVWRGQLDWGDISMPLVWFGDWSWSSYALASPHCAERNFMWQRVEWNVRSLSNKHRLASWLWLFRERGQGKCTSLQVSGTEARTACFWDANAIWFMPGQICPQVNYKIRVDLKWKHHDSASNPRQWGWTCTAGASGRCYLTGSETIRFGIGIVVPEPFTVTDAAISDSNDCQLLTRLCVKHPSAPQF